MVKSASLMLLIVYVSDLTKKDMKFNRRQSWSQFLHPDKDRDTAMEGFAKWLWSFIGNANLTETIIYIIRVPRNPPSWDLSTSYRGRTGFKKKKTMMYPINKLQFYIWYFRVINEPYTLNLMLIPYLMYVLSVLPSSSNEDVFIIIYYIYLGLEYLNT